MLLSGSTAEIKQPEHRYFGGHGGQGRDKTNIVMAWVYGQAPIDLASNLFALASNLLLTCTETLALPSTLLASRPGNGSTVHLCLHCTVLLQMKSGCSLKNGLENEFWTSMRVCRPRKIWWEKSCRRREGISGAWRRKKKTKAGILMYSAWNIWKYCNRPRTFKGSTRANTGPDLGLIKKELGSL
jgi:hypothetical protein|uniref:Uncharacterized protein n=1 Tax=Zea mays TaxID=4577 RepID=A0A804NAS3_MAIZE